MATINYNGMELEEFVSYEPKIFNPPARMVVWDGSYNVVEEDVYVYDPRRKNSYCVITANASWLHCAILHDPPKPRRATNRELSRWLAHGNGECLGSQDDADTAWNYPMESSNAPLCEGAKVRKWSDTEWHEPTVDYLGLEDV
jgi:hypothetical protein